MEEVPANSLAAIVLEPGDDTIIPMPCINAFRETAPCVNGILIPKNAWRSLTKFLKEGPDTLHSVLSGEFTWVLLGPDDDEQYAAPICQTCQPLDAETKKLAEDVRMFQKIEDERYK